jgi:hypothetical protein
LRICDRKEEEISRLIAEGENLDLRELEIFGQWTENSYEALEFDPVLQQGFDEYCRSSSRSIFTRACLGVWMLRLAIEDPSSYRTDHRALLNKGALLPNLPRTLGSESRRKR